MRHEPTLIYGIARKPAADVVVDAALTNVCEGRVNSVARAGIAEAQGATPQQPEEIPLRKLWRSLQSAVACIDSTDHAADEIGKRGVADGEIAARRITPVQRFHQQLGILPHFLGLLAIDARNFAQHVRKAGPAKARL